MLHNIEFNYIKHAFKQSHFSTKIMTQVLIATSIQQTKKYPLLFQFQTQHTSHFPNLLQFTAMCM